jgi:hypothetical protein
MGAAMRKRETEQREVEQTLSVRRRRGWRSLGQQGAQGAGEQV